MTLKHYIDNNPMHWSPEDLLQEILDTVSEDHPCVIEALHILADWDDAAAAGKLPPDDLRHGIAEMFLAKWGFTGGMEVGPKN
jgi:hypothetical protein